MVSLFFHLSFFLGMSVPYGVYLLSFVASRDERSLWCLSCFRFVFVVHPHDRNLFSSYCRPTNGSVNMNMKEDGGTSHKHKRK